MHQGMQAAGVAMHRSASRLAVAVKDASETVTKNRYSKPCPSLPHSASLATQDSG